MFSLRSDIPGNLTVKTQDNTSIPAMLSQ